MGYERMPMQPCGQNRLRMPLFDGGWMNSCRFPEEAECCQCVRLQNPARPGEYADVELCVDCDGNLSICVKRPPRPCGGDRCRHRPRCPSIGCR